MTYSTVSPPSSVGEESSLATATSVGCVLAALGSVAYISLNGMEPREAYSHPVGIVGGLVATAGVVLLALVLVGWRSALPGWAVRTAAAGLVFVAANTWFFGIGIVAVADHTSDAVFETIGTSGWMWGMYFPRMLLCLVAFVTMGVAGWRQRSIPRPAAVILVLAGVLSIWPPYPPGLILASLAFFLIARSGMAAKQ